jgi:hypothetical protein
MKKKKAVVESRTPTSGSFDLEGSGLAVGDRVGHDLHPAHLHRVVLALLSRHGEKQLLLGKKSSVQPKRETDFNGR